jgi:hypothetical protein
MVVPAMSRERITGAGVPPRRLAPASGVRPPAVVGRAGRLLALQRTAGNAAVGALLRAEAAAARRLDRCAGGGCGCGTCGELEDELDGKAWNPETIPDEEIEGRAVAPPRPARRAARVLQRLTITQHSFHQGTCGGRNVEWVFSLDAAAPKDGYIVQHIRSSEAIATCPAKAGSPKLTNEFWEAWFVKKGDKVDWTTTRDKWTDGSTRPSAPNTNGTQSSEGVVKFFGKDVTGDLGDFGKAPADKKSEWGPGKVPTSGALPSTPKKPTWWDTKPIEGPANRVATSVWNCCDADSKKHTSTLTAKPAP